MQIEIPEFDDESPLPSTSFGQQQQQHFNVTDHKRDGSNASSSNHHHHHQQQHHHQPSPFSFTSPIQSSSRPFGGQNHHLINLHSTTIDHHSPNHPHHPHHPHHHHNLDFRNKHALNTLHTHPSPTSPTPNSQFHQNLITRSAPPRKLSVASLRPGPPLKSSNNLEHSRSHRHHGLDLLNSSMGLTSALSSPFSPNISPATSATHHGRSPRSRSETTATSTTNSVNSPNGEAHSPLEVAIYLIMDRFFEECEIKLGQLLGKAIPISNEDDLYIPAWIGQGVDPSFDATFDSLAQVSRKNPNQVINFVMRWKSRQGDGIDEHSIQRAIFSGDNTTNPRRVAAVLTERKGLALVYLLCRALIAIVQGVTRESLGEELGSRLEEIVFNSIKNADTSPNSRNPNKQANMNMFAQLLGALSNIRFTSVSDRFASEIDLTNRAAAIKDQKDSETRLEAFEETAEFIAAFAIIFEGSRGSFVKTAMAETLNPLLAQVVQSATAEVNHPVWNKAIITIFNKAHSMSDKPSKARYWNATVPLICSVFSLFGRTFVGFEKVLPALNKRLEPILKSAFPADRKNVYPAEVSLDTFASLIHYILHWQLEYGSEFTLRTLLTGSSDSGESGTGLVAQAGADRITIGITATLRALTSLEKGEDPVYPVVEPQNGSKSHSSSSHSLNHFHPKDTETDCNDGMALRPETLERPRIKAFVDAVGTKVLQIAAYCDRTLASYTLTNDRYIAPWHDSIAQRADTLDSAMLIKRHGHFAVEYPRHVQPLFDVLQTCVTIASKLALRRFVASDKSYMVLQNYTRFLAKPEFFFRSKAQLQKGSDHKVESLVKFWGLKFVSQMEATSLVLLCSRSSSTRKSALDALRITGTARTIIQESGLITTPKSINFTRNNSVANVLDEAERYLFDTILPDDLPSTEKTRLLKWKKQRKPGSSDSLIRLLESDNPADMTLLCIALSSIFSTALKYLPQTMVHARTLLYSQLQRIYPLASDAAGVGGRSAINGNGPNPGWDDRNLLTSWSSLLISLTSITTSADPKHSNSTRERSISPGEDLIKTLVPFLTSDQSTFREATIRAMSCIHVSMYESLLDGLSGLAHHLTSERKMIEAQNDRSARPNGAVKIIRLFSAIGKLHESTTKFLYYPDFNTTDRCIEILVRFIRESCLFLRSRQSMEDFLTISIRKSFLIFSERVFRKIGMKNRESGFTLELHQVFNHELVIDMFNLAEDWSTRLFSSGTSHHSANGLDARPTRTNSISSRNNVPIKGRSPLASPLSGSGELLLHSATMIATLCETALDFRPASSSPPRPETTREPTPSATRMLRWITALFEKNDVKVHAEARRAFVGACRRTSNPDGLLENALTLCWNESDCWPLDQTLFGIMGSTLICEPSLRLREEAIVALCLFRISHPELATRQRALDEIEVGIQSAFTGHHLVSQNSLSKAISDMKTIDPSCFIVEVGNRIMQVESLKARPLIRLMPTWLAQINLAPTVCDIGSSKVKNLLSIVLLVSSHFVEQQPEAVSVIWLSFANASPLNTAAIITYLLDETKRRGLPAFVRLSRTIFSSMTENSGLEVDPSPLDSGLLPTRSNDLDTHFPQLPSRMGDRLSSVLHAYVVQADHTNVTLRGQMREVLVRYVYMLRRMQECNQTTTSSNQSLPLMNLEDKEAWRSFWDFEETSGSRRHRKILPRNLEHLVEEISQVTSYFITDFRQQWAKVAIEWATQCPVRHVACRSLQVLRILGLPVDSNLLAELLIRLSNTASDPSQEIQLFALEVLTTLSASVKVQNKPIDLLRSILEPLEDSHCFDIEASRPSRWLADGGPIRQLVIKGLRSSQLCQSSWSLIRQLLSLPESCQIVDWVNGGCALLYSACLPWCLHILETGVMQYEMDDIALRLAHLTNWIKSKTLSVLKLYLKMIDSNSSEILELGYDLLTPVLNLLQTNLSSKALEILSEPLPIKAIPNLMGHHSHGHRRHKASQESSGKKVFGNPDETGWCVSDGNEALKETRMKLVNVIETFGMNNFLSETLKRPSMVEFTYEWGLELDSNLDNQTQSDFAETNESFGEMVSTLHDLSDFFGQDGGSSHTTNDSRISSPLNPSTARVAAILSRSLSKRRANRPSLHVRKGSNLIAEGSNQVNGTNGGGVTPTSTNANHPMSSRPGSLVGSTSYSSSSSPSHSTNNLYYPQHQHRTSVSTDYDDIDEEEDEEEEEEEEEEDDEEEEEEEGEMIEEIGRREGMVGEEGGMRSPTGTDDSLEVFGFELDDEPDQRS
ncbi:hypothetical protein DFH28DRAFT_1119418 [Melampsora americana]|nr:hypothetical protein DFH28DRAFT_1119418 [Melampsora americana]